jgi:hypothetical protein
VDVFEVDLARGYCPAYDTAGNCIPQVVDYEEGTLLLDLVDALTNQVVWRGWAQDVVDGLAEDQVRMEAEIDEAVRRIFERFPVCCQAAARAPK